MSETPGLRLHRLVREFRAGVLGAGAFCAQFEQTYNLELDKGTLSANEATAFGQLFEEVVWYSPIPAERAEVPNYRSEEDIAQAAEAAARILDEHRGG